MNFNFFTPKEVLFESINATLGRFVISQLSSGYGITIGNAFRRVLLSSLTGYAIVYIKINGVTHEFSSIPGVYEDITDIILNLKQVDLKKKTEENLFEESIKIILSKKNEFRAGDINLFSQVFEVVNPDLVICSFSKDIDFEIEFKIEKGVGYLCADEIKYPNNVVGIIPIDAIFSPIKNVKIDIENAIVDDKSDYDKLILEILTNGTISPEEALENAAKIIIDIVSVVIKGDIIGIANKKNETIVSGKELSLRKFLKTPIKDFNKMELSTRSINCLLSLGIETLGDLANESPEKLRNKKGFGEKSYNEIIAIIKKYNLENIDKDFNK